MVVGSGRVLIRARSKLEVEEEEEFEEPAPFALLSKPRIQFSSLYPFSINLEDPIPKSHGEILRALFEILSIDASMGRIGLLSQCDRAPSLGHKQWMRCRCSQIGHQS